MPHFVIHTDTAFLSDKDAKHLMRTVIDEAKSTGLFPTSVVKSRIIPFEHSLMEGEEQDLLHIVAWIMGGRTTEQKKSLADRIVLCLEGLYPELNTISIDVRDIDPATYSNK